jgi:hypothetical protein
VDLLLDSSGGHNFHMPVQNNRAGQRSIFVSGLKLYNEIPEDLKREVSRNVFEIKITKFIKESVPTLPSDT